MKPQSLLFDLDGTLVDSDPLHFEAFGAMLAPFGRALSHGDYLGHVMGKSNARIMDYLFPDRPDDHLRLADEKEALFRDRVAAHGLSPMPGLEALLDWAADEGVPTAVVTNAPRPNLDAMLAAAGLAGRFDAIVLGDECARPKPDPLPYIEAMARLGATPARSIAFEDSVSGLAAAAGSGAHVFGVATGLDAQSLIRAGAHAVLNDFTDPALWRLLGRETLSAI